MTKVLISDGQTLLDIALQECGAVEAAFELADANGLSITSELTAGQTLVVPNSSAARPELVAYYAARGHRVNTGSSAAAGAPPEPDPTDPTDFHHPDFHYPDFN